MGTMDKLVEDLLRKPQNSLRDEMVRNALLGRYHDFKTTLVTPKVQLYQDLIRYDYRDLATKTMRGDYDDEPDADDDAAMLKLLADNPDLARLWEALNKETP